MKSYIPQFTKLQVSLLVVVAMIAVGTAQAATLYVGYADSTSLKNNVISYDSTVTGGSPTGTTLITELQSGDASGNFKPYGLALDTAGNLYVSDFSGGTPSTGQIIRYNTNTHVIDLQYSLNTPLAQQHPFGIAVSSNIVYTAAYSNQAVFRNDTTTNPSTPLSAFVAAGANLTGLTQDAAGNIYVASKGAGTVKKYSSTGVLDTGFTLSLTQASGLALDGAGNLYVSSVSGNKINKYDAATGSLLVDSMFTTGLSSPYGIALDGAGNIFAAGYGDGKIYKYSIAGGNASATLFSTLSGSAAISLAFAPEAIPEPSSVALLCIGGLAFVSWKTRKAFQKK